MANRRSLRTELYIGEIDDDELRITLKGKLPRSAQFRSDEVEYRTMSDDSVLTLKYRDGKIIDAEAWPTMTPELEQQIRTAIDAARVPGDVAICRWTMFSRRPVEGTWRYRDDFQIVPAPAEAPRPANCGLSIRSWLTLPSRTHPIGEFSGFDTPARPLTCYLCSISC